MNEETQILEQPPFEAVSAQSAALLINTELAKKAARIIRAVNHPLRQSMISLMNQKQNINVTDIYVNLRIEQSVASQHLKILRASGVVTTRREGKQIYYSVNYPRLNHVMNCSDMLVNQ